MPDNNSAQPPADAVPLADAFKRYTDPQLLEPLGQAEERLKAAEAAVPPQPSWFERGWGGRFEEALEAWRQLPTVRAAGKVRNEATDGRRAVDDERRGRLVSGEWLAWGREDNPWGRWRAIPPDAWNTLVVINEKGGIVRASRSAARLYGVVVAPTQREELAAPALASTIAAEDRCRKWLVDLMVDGKTPSGPRRDYAREARERFQVGSRAFARAWDTAIQETGNTSWRAPGRKPKP